MKLGKNATIKSLPCLLRIKREEVPKLKQSGENTSGGRYTYKNQNDLDILDRAALDDNCIIIVSTEIEHISSGYETVTTKRGETYDRLTTYSTCTLTIRLQCVDDIDDYVEVKSFGHKVDMSSDKALGAATIAGRYGRMQLFGVPTTEGDPDGPDDVRLQDKDIVRSSKQPLVSGSAHKGTSLLKKKSLLK